MREELTKNLKKIVWVKSGSTKHQNQEHAPELQKAKTKCEKKMCGVWIKA